MCAKKIHSMPNLRGEAAETEFRRMYSLSLSHIDKRAEYLRVNYKPSPFNIRWIYGYNPKVGAINLNEGDKTVVFYAACNCGVLYNWTKHQMKILQGHKHMVTNIAASADGRTLVTADTGPENAIIIWDSSDCFPQRTLFNPHDSVKLAKVAISSDAKYLLTLGYQKKAVVYWWIWPEGRDSPHASHEAHIERGGVVDMGFNPYNTAQFVLLAKYDLWLGIAAKIFVTERGILKETNNYELKIRMLEKKPGPDYGRFSCYTFVKDTSQILVATTRGYVLVYANTIECVENVPMDYEKLMFIKMLNIDNKGINVIKSIDGVIVTGNNLGRIKFYDNYMRLMYTMKDIQVDSVRGLSFNLLPRSYQVIDPKCLKTNCPCWNQVAPVDSSTGLVREQLVKDNLPTDATAANKPFVSTDFILCTRNQGIAFVEFLSKKLITILDSKISTAQAVTAHPEKCMVCVGFADGMLELYNYAQRKLFLRIDLREYYKTVIPPNDDSIHSGSYVQKPQISITCLKYSPSGLHLACALGSGKLIFMRPPILSILEERKDTVHDITQIEFSADSLTMATADKGRKVCVYRYDCTQRSWNFIGKQRAHYKHITSIFFLPQKNESGEYKLLSTGMDRMLVEYDTGVVSDDCLTILSSNRVEQTAVPLVGMPWPTPTGLDPEICRVDLPLFLVANDEFKYKVINSSSAKTLSTILGPRYEHPACRIKLVTRKLGLHEEQYMVFVTRDVIGIHKMPLDGNPWKHVGLLGHPVQVVDMSFSDKYEMLFTIGARDSCIIQWAANYGAADISSKNGGDELDPYYCLIENGRPGWLFQEIRDLFYYVQILCQGTFSPAVRRVKDFIPIDSLPDLMRTLGFFPSEYEVENIIAEARYKVYLIEPSQEVDFDQFVKLYLNHRPAYGDSYEKVRNAFQHFADINDDTISKDNFISREEFLDVLTTHGECFSRELCWYLLSILCGHSFEERSNMTEGDFSFLPEKISLKEFLTFIMGLQEREWSEQSIKHSTHSTETLSSTASSEQFD